MTINTAGELVRLARKEARKEALEEAAKIADREADKLMREADKHDIESEDFNCEVYEELESIATVAGTIAHRIRKRAKRSRPAPA